MQFLTRSKLSYIVSCVLPRQQSDEELLLKLSEPIKSQGIIHPLIVASWC